MHWSQRSFFGDPDAEFIRLRREALGEARAPRPDGLDLTLSNPTRAGLRVPNWSGALARGARQSYQPHARGLWAARTAVVAAQVGRQAFDGLAPEDVLLTASTSEAYFLLLTLLCDPGDAVLVPAPSYPLFDHLARLASVRLVPYQLRYVGDWQLDASTLPDAGEIATERIRAVLAVSPNNPTGSLLTTADYDALYELGLPLVVDEVFRPYRIDQMLPDSRRPSGLPLASVDAAERVGSGLCAERLTFVLDGLSKRAAAPGLKLSWLAALGPHGEVSAALSRLEVLADALLSPASAVQHALAEILSQEGEVQQSVKVRLAEDLAILHATLEGSAVTPLSLQAGWSAILRLPSTHSEDEWLGRAAAAGVWMQKGQLYELPFSPAVVVSLLTPPEVLVEGLKRLCQLVDD